MARVEYDGGGLLAESDGSAALGGAGVDRMLLAKEGTSATVSRMDRRAK